MNFVATGEETIDLEDPVKYYARRVIN